MAYVNFSDIAYEMEQRIVAELREAGAERVSADKVGLDYRAGSVYVLCNGIVREGATNSLEYYGGFEYVDREYVIELGNWTFYSDDDERVRECIAHYNEELEEA